jgi:UDP-glucose 4-epimerase
MGPFLCDFLQRRKFRVRGASSRECNLLVRDGVQTFFRDLEPGFGVVFCSVINRWKEDSFDAMTKNMVMAENVALAAGNRCGFLVYLSSVDVYGTSPALPITEWTLPNPRSYYGIGKLASERLLLRTLGERIPVSVLRLPGVYGAHVQERSTLAHFLRKIRDMERVTIFGDGTVLRDFVLVDDLCEVVYDLLVRPRALLLNVATGSSLPLIDILRTLGRVLQREPNLEFGSPDGNSAGNLVFDISALQRAISGLRPTSLEVGCRSILARP